MKSNALAAGLAALIISLPSLGETLTLTASEWPPYIDKEVRGGGFAVSLVSAALERAGYETSFSEQPWPDALEATVDGEYDAIVGIWYTDERSESLAFSAPYIDCEIALIKLTTSDFRFTGPESLIGRQVGVVEDYAYSREAIDRTGIEVITTGSVAEAVAKLRSGELDLVVADRRVAFSHINERALAKSFDVLPNPLLTRGLRIAVPRNRPDHTEIITAFDAAISEMRADGTYNSILASFRISTW